MHGHGCCAETKVQQIEVPTKTCSNHAHGKDIDVTIDSAGQKLDAVHRAHILILQFPVHRSAAAPTDSFVFIIIITINCFKTLFILFLCYYVYRKSTQINEQGIN